MGEVQALARNGITGDKGDMVILLESVQDCLGHGTQALTIYNVLGIFFFLWGGAGLALVTVLAEYIFEVILTSCNISFNYFVYRKPRGHPLKEEESNLEHLKYLKY